MGLGPPVCQHCKVYARLNDDGWYCRFCGETDIKDFHAYMNGNTKYLEDNEKFLEFMLNKGETKNEID